MQSSRNLFHRIVALVLTLVAYCSLSASPRVSLLTAMPGSEIYELEGHTALRIVDSDAGVDCVVNWGVFDFNAPNFVGRFVAGETDYMCVETSTQYFLSGYKAQGRLVVEQTLGLDSLQTARLIELLANNLQPQNRVYRYNYIKDNCATRPLALIEAAAGRQLIDDEPAGTTFRNEMRRYHADYLWYQFGVDLALGREIDRPISCRETVFAPVALMQELGKNDIVESTATYGVDSLRTTRTPWLLTPFAVSLFILLISVLVCFTKSPRLFDSIFFSVLFLLGCLLTFLVFVSQHEATSPNILMLWLNPLCLLGAILPWIKSAKKAAICYFFVNFALLILLVALVPILGRGMNAAFWLLIAADMVRSFDNLRRRCTKKANRS